MEAIATILGIGLFILVITVGPKLWGQLWWKLTPPETVTTENIDFCIRRYGYPPRWWIEKNGPPPESAHR